MLRRPVEAYPKNGGQIDATISVRHYLTALRLFSMLFLSCKADVRANFKGGPARPSPITEAFNQHGSLQVADPSAQAIPALLDSTPRHPSNQGLFVVNRLTDGIILQQ
jgi:hypothetical protein